MAQKEYLDAFNDELNGFKGRIRARAKQKIDEAIKEHEEVTVICGW
jgi:cell division cycle protein 37